MAKRLILPDNIEELLVLIAQRAHVVVSLRMMPYYTGTEWELEGDLHYEDWVPKLGARKRRLEPFQTRAKLMRLLKRFARR